ncbi:hypothetical protein SAMN05444166_0128 [Singulisphaera sp. GP187]|uniref:hypothetical protein n=1 Tax=Singulisphaera sp. GP187 TaxID=1882752 RepID=UPI00092A5EAF|nr:hypothetical protein [Singulisphaera sp. GP187]SIN68859.1 hypothetical protein SAMN05444166_0128 [Singulisphaera sp. GP187]
MDSILRRLIASWIKSQELAPRRAPTAAVRCESLEGRQLLSTTGLLRGHMGMPSSPTTQRVQLSTRGTMGGQNAGGFGSGAAETSSYTQARPFGNFSGHGNAMSGGAGRVGFAMRHGQVARAGSQSLPTTPPTAPPTTQAVNAVVATNTDTTTAAVPTDTPTQAAVTTTLQAAPTNTPVTTTQFNGGAPAVGAGTFNAMPSGPMGGWFGGNAENRQPVNSSVASGQQTNGSGTTSSSTSGPSDALKSDFEKLQTDLQAIHDKSEVTPKLLAAVRNDFDAIQKASTTDPDQDAVKALAATVDSIAGQIPTADQQTQLVADFTAVLKSQGITDQTLIDTAVADIQAVVAASHVTADDLTTIAADRKAIKTEMDANANPDAPPSATPTTGDAVGSLMSGLTGGFESGIPMAGAFDGGAPGGPYSVSPIAFSSAGGVMMGGGGQFNGSPITVSPSGGGMTGPIHIAQGSVMMDGGDQFGPFSVTSANGVGTSGQFRGSRTDVSFAGGAPGGQFGQYNVSPNGGGPGGQFGGRWGR